MSIDGGTERRAREAGGDLSEAAAAYWRLWVANWTPPFEDDAPWRQEQEPCAAPGFDAAPRAEDAPPMRDAPYMSDAQHMGDAAPKAPMREEAGTEAPVRDDAA